MADLRIKSSTSLVTHGIDDGTPVDVRGTRDGALYTAPWLTALALEGRCFGVNIATGTSPQTFSGAWVVTTPDLYIQVPVGTTIIPVYIEVSWEDTDTAGVIDCVATISSVRDTSPGGNALTIYNMRTDRPYRSMCSANSIATTVTTPYTGNFLEFWRGTAGMLEDAFNGTTAPTSELNSKTFWSVSEAVVPPVIVGNGSLSVWSGKGGTTAETGWLTAIWAEVPSKSIV